MTNTLNTDKQEIQHLALTSGHELQGVGLSARELLDTVTIVNPGPRGQVARIALCRTEGPVTVQDIVLNVRVDGTDANFDVTLKAGDESAINGGEWPIDTGSVVQFRLIGNVANDMGTLINASLYINTGVG